MEIPDDAAEREGVIRGIKWLCLAIGPKGIVTKILAMRYLLHMESRSMEVVGEEYGICRASISKHVCAFGAAMGLPTLKTEAAKEVYAERQRQVWADGKRKRKPKILD